MPTTDQTDRQTDLFGNWLEADVSNGSLRLICELRCREFSLVNRSNGESLSDCE